jgi:16S rRNA (guanine(527)-N(7))-methyltransferase RsmG
MIELKSTELIDKYLDISLLDIFLDGAEQANGKFNLFSKTLVREDLNILVAESLLPIELGWIDENSGAVIDVGSGWGIPAIPILLAIPELSMTMVERSQKKAGFVNLMLHRLGLKATVVDRSINELQKSSSFSVVTLRQILIDTPITRNLQNLTTGDSTLVYFGPTLPENIFTSSESITYAIDNIAPRRIFRARFF